MVPPLPLFRYVIPNCYVELTALLYYSKTVISSLYRLNLLIPSLSRSHRRLFTFTSLSRRESRAFLLLSFLFSLLSSLFPLHRVHLVHALSSRSSSVVYVLSRPLS